MAAWLGQCPRNPVVAVSSPTLTTKLELFLGTDPSFNSSAVLVNSQLDLLPVGIFNHDVFICIIFLFHHLVTLVLKNPIGGVVN